VTELPPRARRRQQPDETHSLILDVAERMLRERPFRELSVDELMRATGYGRTVFYRHFSGLPEVVLAVLGRVLPGFQEVNAAFLRQAGDPISRAGSRAVLTPLVAHWRTHGPLMKALRDAAVYDPEIDALVDAAQASFRAATVEALRRRRRAAGGLRDADLEQLAAALIAMTQRYLLIAYGDADSTLAPEVAVETLALVWTAVLRAQ
jgi:TetR/AcrR family transcriptional regulator, ethionamide resistance regulator